MAEQRYDQDMSSVPPWPPPSPSPPPWPAPPIAARSEVTKWPGLAAIAIALVAVGLAIGAWFRPLPDAKPPSASPGPTFSDQQVAAAKTGVCAAYHQVRQALDSAGARNGGTDPTASLAVATASRQALDAGSRYLLTKLAEEPATNPELATAVRKLADLYQAITISYLADFTESEIKPLRQAADQPTATIDGLCK